MDKHKTSCKNMLSISDSPKTQRNTKDEGKMIEKLRANDNHKGVEMAIFILT